MDHIVLDATPLQNNAKPSKPPSSPFQAAQEPFLQRLGIRTWEDLALHLPFRYEDETQVTSIAALYRTFNEPLLSPGGGPSKTSTVQIEGTVESIKWVSRPRRAMVAEFQDATGTLMLRFLHVHPGLMRWIKAGAKLRVLGVPRLAMKGLEMVHPRFKVVLEGEALPTQLTPVYPTTQGLHQNKIRSLVHQSLKKTPLEDTLPTGLLKKIELLGFKEALGVLHQPDSSIPPQDLENRTHPAWQRIKFDELLAEQLAMLLLREARLKKPSVFYQKPGFQGKKEERLEQRLESGLPFTLTGDQKKVLEDIFQDLKNPYPMQRLLQGDVGSGKTIVAALSAAAMMEEGFQVALMAPTDILAEQHAKKLTILFEETPFRVGLLTSRQPPQDRRRFLEDLAQGRIHLAIGTHALFQSTVHFAKLGFIIIDEQHRFGVLERMRLCEKGLKTLGEEEASLPSPAWLECVPPEGGAEVMPHVLIMSATPIPRTLAMASYADMDLSVIHALPSGRKPITTKLINSPRRLELMDWVAQECKAGRQAYWVCPLIEPRPQEEGEGGPEEPRLEDVVTTLKTFQTRHPDLPVAVLHGRLSSQEKSEVMGLFEAGTFATLVATSVIEVGIDVPRATLMVVEHAERMGLAQLHQLRGRIGRGREESTCFLVYQNPLSDVAKMRLKVLKEKEDGFSIAQADLMLRGPGEILGDRQSGLATFRFANLAQDEALLIKASKVARYLLRHHVDIAQKHLNRWMPHHLAMAL